jgi:hypothetical protein
MGTAVNAFEAQLAKKTGAGLPRHDRSTVGEECDTDEGRQLDELAEQIAGREVDRRTAAIAAKACLVVLQAKERAALGRLAVGFVGGVDGAAKVAGMGWMFEADASDKMLEAMSMVWSARDATLAQGCLFFAMGRPPYGCASMRRLAELRGVSVQAVSATVDEFQTVLGLPRTQQQKSDRAVETYRRTNGALRREHVGETK